MQCGGTNTPVLQLYALITSCGLIILIKIWTLNWLRSICKQRSRSRRPASYATEEHNASQPCHILYVGADNRFRKMILHTKAWLRWIASQWWQRRSTVDKRDKEREKTTPTSSLSWDSKWNGSNGVTPTPNPFWIMIMQNIATLWKFELNWHSHIQAGQPATARDFLLRRQ